MGMDDEPESTESTVEILDGLQNLEVLGRRMSRRVLRESGAVWAGIWDEVIRIQETNPDVRRIAETKTDDPELAILELVPQLMLLNPVICRGVAAFCHGVVAEFGYLGADPVAPPRDALEPEGEQAFAGDGERDVHDHDGGGQQQQDRLAELEDENRRLRIERDQLRDVLRLVRDLAAGPWAAVSES